MAKSFQRRLSTSPSLSPSIYPLIFSCAFALGLSTKMQIATPDEEQTARHRHTREDRAKDASKKFK